MAEGKALSPVQARAGHIGPTKNPGRAAIPTGVHPREHTEKPTMDILPDPLTLVNPVDRAWAYGYAVGHDGYLGAGPPEGLTGAESDAWTLGHSEGLEAALEAMEAYYRATGRLDPDPWNEATSVLAGHPDRIN